MTLRSVIELSLSYIPFVKFKTDNRDVSLIDGTQRADRGGFDEDTCYSTLK